MNLSKFNMSTKTIPIVCSIVAAPVGFGLLFAIGLREGNHDFEIYSPIGLLILGYFLGLIPVLAFGWPVFVLMLRYKIARWWTTLLAGCSISVVLTAMGGIDPYEFSLIPIFPKYGSIMSLIFYGTYKLTQAKFHDRA